MVSGVSVLEARLDDLLPTWKPSPSGFAFEMVKAAAVHTMSTDELHRHITRVGELQAHLAGLMHQATAALCLREPESAAEIVASALDETVPAAERLCETGWRLVTAHPQAVAGLLDGSVGMRQATVLERTCRTLPVAIAQSVDAAVWDKAGPRADPTEVKRAAVALALRVDPGSSARRVKDSRAERHVELTPGPEGTTWLGAQLATEDALACRDALNEGSRASAVDDPRTRTQRAADLLVERITGRPPLLVADGRWVGPEPAEDTAGATVRGRDRRVEIQVLVPFDVLTGLRQGHATIDGEPVPASVARGLFQSDAAVMRRMLTDPVEGHLLDRAAKTYQPGRALKAFVQSRDRECWWPGCHKPARRCDEDHKVPFPDGLSTRVNIGALCEHHHQLKHSGLWRVEVRPDGTVDLTGPDGHTRHVTFPRLDDGPIWYDPPPQKGKPPAPQEEPPPDRDAEPPF